MLVKIITLTLINSCCVEGFEIKYHKYPLKKLQKLIEIFDI